MSDKKMLQYSAADAALGYLYQVRSALYWALRRQKTDPDFLVGVETLDDVTFETVVGDPSDLLQTKHHQSGVGSLTDASPDLWKTLRIWFDGHASAAIPITANLYLVTTGSAGENSAAARLRASPRDVAAAKHALDATASSSTNKDNAAAYHVYLSASDADRIAILEKVIVIDAAPCVTDLEDNLRQEVYWAAGKEHHGAFLERLEGWWLRRVLRQLVDSATDRIGSVELEAQMSDLREQFKPESLPIDEDLLEFALDKATQSAHADSVFVYQLELVEVGQRRLSAAIRDYYRAFEQRSRWLRDDLVVGMDLHKYEKRLVEEWELVFDAMRDELGSSATDQVQEEAARSVLAWAEQTPMPIRPNVTEPFVSRGSFHMLSDDARIGWHPEFETKLASLISEKAAKA